MDKKYNDLVYLFNRLTDRIEYLFDIDKEKAFTYAMSILALDDVPSFNGVSEEANLSIESYFKRFKKENYPIDLIRRAYNEAYLYSLRDIKDLEIETTSELISLYLRYITKTIASLLDYDHVNILNPSPNSGSFLSSLALTEGINEEDLVAVEDREKFYRITTNLRDLCKLRYKVIDTLPSLSYRSDIIVSDPFLRKVEDILIFFEDYHEYLNIGGFFVVSLMTDFVKSRVFSDMLERYSLKLIGVIEYPKDLYEGLIKNSIVILEYKGEDNKEFFTAEMPSVQKIEDNYKVLNNIGSYLKGYLEGEKNENNVN